MTNRILRHRYQIDFELGKGGFGTTYLAVDLDLPDCPQCVVKQLTPSDPRPEVFQEAKKLFDKEAKILHRLGKHEQIPQLFAYFEEGGQFYLVQEFIEGYDLTKEIYSRSRFTENQTFQLLTEILSILKYVHQQNVIHRDLKPQNIMRRKYDGKIVLIDFGAVKEIKGLTVIRGDKTTMTIAVGTPGYMPMEQAGGQPKFCSDIYAVGMMAIEALTGVDVNQFPKDSSTGEIIWKDRVNVSDDLGRVLDKMVLYDWRDRYHSIDEVMAELIGDSYSAHSPTYQPTIPSGKPVNNSSATVVRSTVFPNVRNLPQTQPPPSNVPLVSASRIDYTKLRDLLATGKWKEANQETNIVIRETAKVRWFGKLNSENIKKIPCIDLQTIDQLWVKYSNGHFGFSVQKQIYLDTGNLPNIYNEKTYTRFGERVGWKLKRNRGFYGGWLSGYDNVIFDRKAPRGHLPILRFPFRRKKWKLLLNGFVIISSIFLLVLMYYLLINGGWKILTGMISDEFFLGFIINVGVVMVLWLLIFILEKRIRHSICTVCVKESICLSALSQKLDEYHNI
ncbi:protein kinase domain-containing protein [Dapis sp. BLCC M229]|uniref:protein kinase domain-containing protein n=1 Tax=Dapis sp. BLCC M229 TaxID=3400188 RepID=UPI003CF7C561